MNINLRTSRLNITPISFSDLEIIHELHSLPETDRFISLGIPENLDQTKGIIKEWIENNNSGQYKNFTFRIELIESKSFIGLISLNLGKPKFKNAEVWYIFHYKFWNKGYATESLNRILEFAFDELKLHRVEAGSAVENLGSIRTLEKVGMTREGRRRKFLPLKEGWTDTFEYAILSTDFKSNKHNTL